MIASASREARIYEHWAGERQGGRVQKERERERGRQSGKDGEREQEGDARERAIADKNRRGARPITLPYLYPVAPQLLRFSKRPRDFSHIFPRLVSSKPSFHLHSPPHLTFCYPLPISRHYSIFPISKLLECKLENYIPNCF